MESLASAGVVVVTHGSAGTILPCLRSLPLDRVAGTVVVDNDSPDNTAAVVDSAALPNVQLVRAPNDGFGAGCNRGAQILASSRWIAFVNPDAVLPPGTLETLITYLDKHPRVAMVAPRLYRGGTALTSAGTLPTMTTELRFVVPPRLVRFMKERRLNPSYDRTGGVGYVEGACMVVDARAFFDCGGFDRRFFLYFEEADLARRLRRAKREVHLVAEAAAEHLGGESTSAAAWGARPHYFASTVRYLRKWRGPQAAAGYHAMTLVSWWFQRRRGYVDPATDANKAGLRGGWRTPSLGS
jgi:N-acetylglucosaminyl-diphospho-decaprenol L-rhamnosyltransferase